MAENNSSAPLKTAEGAYPAPLIDGAWYWVRYFGLFKETEAPAQYKEACCAFYSVSFSGVPVAEVEILAPLAVEAQAPAAVAVPEGYALVPIEPTAGMCKAAADGWLDCGSKMVLNKAGAAYRSSVACFIKKGVQP